MSESRATPSPMFAFAEAYVLDEAERDPMLATYVGVPGHEDQLTDFSMSAARESLGATIKAEADLAAIEITDDNDRVAHAVMAERLAARRRVDDAFEGYRAWSVISSPVANVRQVFELMSAESSDDAGVIATRLRGVDAALSSWCDGLSSAADAGIVAPRRHVIAVADQARTHAEGGYEAFAARAAASCGVDVEASGLLNAARSAQAAAGATGDWLREAFASRATAPDAAGAERYALWSSFYSGIDVDFAELYEWGTEDLLGLHERMVALGRRLAPDASSLIEVANALDVDDAGAVFGEEALVERLLAFTEAAVASMNGPHFDIDPRVQFCDARIAPPGSAAAPYYIPPSEDLSRPGITWFPTLGETRFPWWRIPSTWYHEAVPGHHLQEAMIALRHGELTRFQRQLAWTSGVGEGWALYAERFMDELGAFSPAEEFGYLANQALRAARIVVDLGLHLGYPVPSGFDDALGESDTAGSAWTPERAVALIDRWVIQSHAMSVSEVERYLGIPAQAISYKLGERTWRSTRDAASERLGSRFSLKAFHQRALSMGPMGLRPFVDLLSVWDGD
ncbi:MAG: DUF885 domain-containing protein [Acidimicrobiales bacterium]